MTPKNRQIKDQPDRSIINLQKYIRKSVLIDPDIKIELKPKGTDSPDFANKASPRLSEYSEWRNECLNLTN
jgi:hypothetical protein